MQPFLTSGRPEQPESSTQATALEKIDHQQHALSTSTRPSTTPQHIIKYSRALNTNDRHPVQAVPMRAMAWLAKNFISDTR